MISARELLVELLVEELPPKALRVLGREFAARLADELVSMRSVEPEDADKHTSFATPRRLAVLIPNVLASAPETRDRQKLMPRKVAFGPDGSPTASLHKKLRSLGYPDGAVPFDDFVTRAEGNAEYVYLDQVKAGRSLAENLQVAIEAALKSLPIPKVMQYQLADGWTTVQFVRPAHGLVALHGPEVLHVRALGLEAGRFTQGHRFEALRPRIELRDAGSYETQLRDEGAVIASFAARRAEVARQLASAGAKAGLTPVDDPALLDEVTALVERPNVLTCEFEAEFLAVPPECLVLTMKANQKYFPLLDAKGALTNRFLVVSNIAPDDPSRIVEGNERVVRPRLADAKFFFDQDRRKTLESRVPALDKVVYHGKLGSQGERVQRVRAIARAIGAKLGGLGLTTDADRAALLAKADLTTDMVGEFPELQGVMGRYYALHDGEPGDVAFAIEDQYRPRFAGDTLPRNEVGVVLAMADKLETVVGLFGIGQAPSGDKDPFALRRHALGIVRLLIERNLPLKLLDVVDLARDAMPSGARGDWLPPFQFILDRATGYFEDQGLDRRAVASVLGPHGALFPLGQLPDLLREATRFIASPEGQVLAEANKRITNILKKSGADIEFGISPRDLPLAPDVSLFQYDEERSLLAALLLAGEEALALRRDRKFAEALSALTPLSEPTKAFFDRVMVNVEDKAIRDNRIKLLQHARAYMNQVADLTLMAT